jgi:hypothetical protein
VCPTHVPHVRTCTNAEPKGCYWSTAHTTFYLNSLGHRSIEDVDDRRHNLPSEHAWDTRHLVEAACHPNHRLVLMLDEAILWRRVRHGELPLHAQLHESVNWFDVNLPP